MVIEMIMMKIWKKVDGNCILFGNVVVCFLMMKIEMLWHFFNCNFLKMIRNLSIMKVFVVTK